MRTLVVIVAILLVAAIIGVCVLRFGFPDKWDGLVRALFGDSSLHDGELVVRFLDVGQGDGIYIEFPDGKDMLIDMGSTLGYSEKAAVEELTALNDDGKIDHLMLTHTDQDHVAFLDAVIYAFDVGNIYMPNVLATPKTSIASGAKLAAQIEELDEDKLALFTDPDTVDTNTYAEFFIAALTEENCAIHLNVDPSDDVNSIVIEGEGYALTFYCPTQAFYDDFSLSTAEKLNAVSPVGILEFNGRRIVFTGDSNSLNEPLVAPRFGTFGYIDCDVLKVAHHGSASSSTDDFLAAVNCEYAVISCGAGNSYHHPTNSALKRLRAHGMTVYRTDNNGDVTLIVDGDGNLNFQVEKPLDEQLNFVGADD